MDWRIISCAAIIVLSVFLIVVHSLYLYRIAKERRDVWAAAARRELLMHGERQTVPLGRIEIPEGITMRPGDPVFYKVMPNGGSVVVEKRKGDE